MWRGNVRLYTLRELMEKKSEQDFLKDYYDANQVPLKKELIWSEESENHPDHGKDLGGNVPNRPSYSLFISFLILGAVITFIVCVYLQHVLIMRELSRRERAERLRVAMESSVRLLASSGQSKFAGANQYDGRRRSILRTFRKFRL